METSAPELKGQYVGQAEKLVEEKMAEARGGILFVDEAYELTRQAISQLLTLLTRPEHEGGKTVVIMAGYTERMHQMLETNPGLKRRFSSFVDFADWDSGRCAALTVQLLEERNGYTFKSKADAGKMLECTFDTLRNRPGWGNAGDAVEMSKKVMTERLNRLAAGGGGEEKAVLQQDIRGASSVFIRSRPPASPSLEMKLNALVGNARGMPTPEARASFAETPIRTQRQTRNHDQKLEKGNPEVDEGKREGLLSDMQRMIDDLEAQRVAAMEEADRRLEEERSEQERLAIEAEKKRLEEELERERMRLEELLRQMEREKELRKVRAMKEKEEKRRRVIQALRNIGRCVAGFEWIRTGNGFRCAGRTHYASFGEVSALAGMSMEDISAVM